MAGIIAALGCGCTPDAFGAGSTSGATPGSASGSGSPATATMTSAPEGTTAIADGGGSDGSTSPPMTGADSTSAGDSAGTEESTGACVPQPWYPDEDEDGFGDPDRQTVSCRPPDGHVADDTDCDDEEPTINPDADEQCNEVDDDCDGVTDEGSPANGSCDGCSFVGSNDGSRYFAVCGGTSSWDEALTICQDAFGPEARLARIDDPADQAALLGLIAGVDHWLSLNDLAREGVWRWHDDSVASMNGMPVGFDGWRGGQPVFGNGERCGELDAGGWADSGCGQGQPRICEHQP